MDFISESEYFSTVILYFAGAIILFFIISFIHIFDKYEEVLFISLNHKYQKTDLLTPALCSLFFLIILLTPIHVDFSYDSAGHKDPSREGLTWVTLIRDYFQPFLDNVIKKISQETLS